MDEDAPLNLTQDKSDQLSEKPPAQLTPLNNSTEHNDVSCKQEDNGTEKIPFSLISDPAKSQTVVSFLSCYFEHVGLQISLVGFLTLDVKKFEI